MIKTPFCFYKYVLLAVMGVCTILNSAIAEQGVITDSVRQVKLELTTHLGDRQVFLVNDKLHFFISLDHSAYVYAFYKNAENNIFQISPGKAQSNHFFTEGIYIPFPEENSVFKFQVVAPFGEEKIFLYASDQKQIDFVSFKEQHNILRLKMSQKEIHNHIKTSSNKLFGKTELVIQTKN